MQRFLVPGLAALAMLAGSSLPHPAAAQNRPYQNGGTTTGDSWMNENDFDYNRQHWTAPNNRAQTYGDRYQQGDQRDDGRGYNRHGQQDQYQNNYGQPQYGNRNQGYYGQNNGRSAYGNQPNSGQYGNRSYAPNDDNRYGGDTDRRGNHSYGRSAPYSAPGYDDED